MCAKAAKKAAAGARKPAGPARKPPAAAAAPSPSALLSDAAAAASLAPMLDTFFSSPTGPAVRTFSPSAIGTAAPLPHSTAVV